MIRLIYQKLFSNNSLVKQATSYGIILLIIIQIPVSFLLFLHFRNSDLEKSMRYRAGLEEVLTQVFVESAKYGDLVNSRAVLLKQGSQFGLDNVGVCYNGIDITPQIDDARCIGYDSSKPIELFDRKFNLTFFWKDDITFSYADIIAPITIVFFLSGTLLFLVILLISKRLSNKVSSVSVEISKLKTISELSQISTKIRELVPIEVAFRKLRENLDDIIAENTDLKSNLQFGQIAKQVAHDIRSPLAALDMIMKGHGEVCEEDRFIMRSAISRIYSIADNILSYKRNVVNGDLSINNISKEDKKVSPLSWHLESIIAEKKVQYQSCKNILIECSLDESIYGLCSNIQVTEFKRVISNLVNNSVESFGSNGGKVIIDIIIDNGLAIVEIRDNGCGISKEVLQKIGTMGESSKVNGNGLGICHAINSIESWDGNISIESKELEGTTVSISLPLAERPKSFVSEIIVENNLTIVILDDDDGVHKVWEKRFGNALNSIDDFKLIHFYSVSELVNWYECSSHKNEKLFYLIDFELLDSDINGLELIERLNIQDKANIVTGYFEEDVIVKTCEFFNVGLIPKSMVVAVPIINI